LYQACRPLKRRLDLEARCSNLCNGGCGFADGVKRINKPCDPEIPHADVEMSYHTSCKIEIKQIAGTRAGEHLRSRGDGVLLNSVVRVRVRQTTMSCGSKDHRAIVTTSHDLQNVECRVLCMPYQTLRANRVGLIDGTDVQLVADCIAQSSS
jgi:hypothetical protein